MSLTCGDRKFIITFLGFDWQVAQLQIRHQTEQNSKPQRPSVSWFYILKTQSTLYIVDTILLLGSGELSKTLLYRRRLKGVILQIHAIFCCFHFYCCFCISGRNLCAMVRETHHHLYMLAIAITIIIIAHHSYGN